MKSILLALTITGVSTWTFASAVNAGEGAQCNKQVKTVVLQSADDGTAPQGEVRFQTRVVVGDGEGGNGEMFMFAGAPGDENVDVVQVGDGPQVIRLQQINDDRLPVNLNGVTQINVVAEADSENRGWLGVQLGQLNEERQEALGDTKGIAVLNVAEGSPAAAAGFEQHDLVVEIDDQSIGDALSDFVHAIGDSGPGKRVKFGVIRDGQRRTLVATLANRGDVGEVTWIYETPEDAFLHQSVKSHFKFITKDDDGNWVMQNSGDLSHLPTTLSNVIGKFGPGHLHDKQVEVRINNGERQVSVSTTQDGVTLHIDREGGGPIVVNRVDEHGVESVMEYVDIAALEAGDPEAAEAFADVSENTFTIKLDGAEDFHFGTQADPNIWVGSFDDMDDHLGEAMDALKDMNITVDLNGANPADAHKYLMHRIHGAHKAHRSIAVNPDGSIDVTIRKAGDELVFHYLSADDLANRDPENYDRYLDLIDADVDD
jgi:hypothetical protein